MVIPPLGDHGTENCSAELKLRFPHILSTEFYKTDVGQLMGGQRCQN